MAGPNDYFSPGTWQDPTGPSLMENLTRTLADPRIAAGTMQAGLNLMAGPTWGDTGMSQIARAVGSGGEAIGRQEQMNRAQQEADSKEQLRGAQAGAAEARAGTAATTADLARARLGIAEGEGERKKQSTALQLLARAQSEYRGYQNVVRMKNQAIQKENADILNTGPKKPMLPELSYGEWLPQSGYRDAIPVIQRALGHPVDEATSSEHSPGGAPTLAVGTERGGYRFKGGDAGQEANWEKIP